MAEVIDRRTHVGAQVSYGSPSGRLNGGAPSRHQKSSTSPSKVALRRDESPAASPTRSNGKAKDTSETASSAKSGAASRWAILNGNDDGALARVQQFIVETLKNPVQFVLSEASVAAPVPYKPINDPATLAQLKADREARREAKSKKRAALDRNGETSSQGAARASGQAAEAEAGPSKISQSPQASPSKKRPDLFPHHISLHPPRDAAEHATGLVNRGNTCYMNSTLQALMHLPPLAHALLTLDADELYGRMGGPPAGRRFDALGEMQKLERRAASKQRLQAPVAPGQFIANLKSYARTLTPYRQEDAHEFLRFLLEAMQACSVSRAPKSLQPFDRLRETTLIHKVFGGRLRSRVQCQRCKHNSDTFELMLDLSLDIRRLPSDTLSAALANFTGVDTLSGSQKYKCEKCNRPVEATKQFSIHEPPAVLTVHFKRFTMSGQKISKPIAYSEEIVLGKQVLSEGVASQRYRLHAVVFHHGSGPNSGHYIASVRGLNSGAKWYEMNDSSVRPTRGAPTSAPNAYMLFYVRAPGSALDGVLQGPRAAAKDPAVDAAEGIKKRWQRLDDSSDVDQLASSQSATGGSDLAARKSALSDVASSQARTASPLSSLDTDDDLGEAIAPRSLNDKYESLTGSRGAENGSAFGKKRKFSSDGGRNTAERGANSLVRSPYLAGPGGRASKSLLGARHRNPQQQSHFRNRGGNGSSGFGAGARMKNRFGQRI